MFGWIIFRAQSWDNFLEIINSLSNLTPYAANIDVLLLSAIGFGFLIHFTPLRLKRIIKMQWLNYYAVFQGAIAAIVTVFLYHIAVADII